MVYRHMQYDAPVTDLVNGRSYGDIPVKVKGLAVIIYDALYFLG